MDAELALFREIAELVAAHMPGSELELVGGGNTCVTIPLDADRTVYAYWGTANEKWGATLYTMDGDGFQIGEARRRAARGRGARPRRPE